MAEYCHQQDNMKLQKQQNHMKDPVKFKNALCSW